MRLKPIADADIGLVAGWLAREENYQWLDFGNGHQTLTTVALKIMAQQPTHLLRLFTAGAEEKPIGLVGLSKVDRQFHTATLWYVLGDKSFSGRGYTTRAVSLVLALAFADLGLQAVNAWAVDQNTPSIRVLERNGFRYIGRQRRCHYVRGEARDRLLFDLLAAEHSVITDP
jgi:RimJ/RimL family protein N-acetyltransferase